VFIRLLTSIVLAGAVLVAGPIPAYADESSRPSCTARFSHWLRGKIVEPEDLRAYGLHLDQDWREQDADKNLVVLIHGFNSKGELNSDLIQPLRDEGFPCALFDYPNDGSLAKSAKLLSEELNYFASMYPQRGISLVTHSMGGLIARACIENPELNCRNVRQLIMLATPNHGSLLAHFTWGSDCWEHGRFWNHSGGPWKRIKRSFADGLCEAGDDLKPGSDFLVGLNARKRNGLVRYTIVLGTGAYLNGWELNALRKSVRLSTKPVPYVKSKGERLDQLLADLDEVIEGRGDGVVAVKRGRLDGVEDTVVLPFSHLNITEKAETEAVEEVHKLVFSRLKTAPTGVPEAYPVPGRPLTSSSLDRSTSGRRKLARRAE